MNARGHNVRRRIPARQTAALFQRQPGMQYAMCELRENLGSDGRIRTAHQDFELAAQGSFTGTHGFGALAIEAEVGNRLHVATPIRWKMCPVRYDLGGSGISTAAGAVEIRAGGSSHL
jgi:hypothetical protein